MAKNIATQIELDAALKSGDRELKFTQPGEYEINDTDGFIDIYAEAELNIYNFKISTKANIRLRTRGSSQPHVVAWGSSQPHVVARGSSQPHVEAWESSQPHVEARESSQPHVVAKGFVQLSIFGKVIATLTAKCQVMIRGSGAKVEGGYQTVVDCKTPEDWCEYYGVDIKDGIAILYKAVRDCYGSNHDADFKYLPGTMPKAATFNDRECSDGLHFCATPRHALTFHTSSKRFIACPVKVSDMLVNFDWDHPEKCKAPAVVAPCWEVDINGKAIEPVKEAA